MAYGQNQPWGLRAIKTLGSATWNGQTSQYRIKSGYPNNIFKGDLVYLGTDGYIHNLSDRTKDGPNRYQITQALGVFNGCSFTTPTSINPIDPASPGRSFWPALTETPGGVDAFCDIIDDPNTIYDVQSAGGPTVIPNPTPVAGLPFTAQGRTASVAYSYVAGSGTNPTGNLQTGTSSLVIDTTTVGSAADVNLRIIRFVPVENNVPGNGAPAINFNNVEVMIQNHSYASRPPAVTP